MSDDDKPTPITDAILDDGQRSYRWKQTVDAAMKHQVPGKTINPWPQDANGVNKHWREMTDVEQLAVVQPLVDDITRVGGLTQPIADLIDATVLKHKQEMAPATPEAARKAEEAFDGIKELLTRELEREKVFQASPALRLFDQLNEFLHRPGDANAEGDFNLLPPKSDPVWPGLAKALEEKPKGRLNQRVGVPTVITGVDGFAPVKTKKTAAFLELEKSILTPAVDGLRILTQAEVQRMFPRVVLEGSTRRRVWDEMLKSK